MLLDMWGSGIKLFVKHVGQVLVKDVGVGHELA